MHKSISILDRLGGNFMKVTVGVEYKKTAPLESTNPLPVFRDRNHHSAEKKLHPSLREEHSQLIGYDCGSRILP